MQETNRRKDENISTWIKKNWRITSYFVCNLVLFVFLPTVRNYCQVFSISLSEVSGSRNSVLNLLSPWNHKIKHCSRNPWDWEQVSYYILNDNVWESNFKTVKNIKSWHCVIEYPENCLIKFKYFVPIAIKILWRNFKTKIYLLNIHVFTQWEMSFPSWSEKFLSSGQGLILSLITNQLFESKCLLSVQEIIHAILSKVQRTPFKKQEK